MAGWNHRVVLTVGFGTVAAALTVVGCITAFSSQDDPGPFFLHGLSFWILTVILAAVCYQDWRRARRWSRLARACGFSFTARAPKRDLLPFVHLPLLRRTLGVFGTFARNRLEGTFDGRPVILMDYGYYGTVTSGRFSWGEHKSQQTIVLLPGGAAGLPNFVLATQSSVWQRFAAAHPEELPFALPGPDASPDFARRLMLAGPDPDGIRKLFTKETLDYFAGIGSGDWGVQAWGGDLLVYRENVRCEPADGVSLLRKALDIWGELNGVLPRGAESRRSGRTEHSIGRDARKAARKRRILLLVLFSTPALGPVALSVFTGVPPPSVGFIVSVACWLVMIIGIGFLDSYHARKRTAAWARAGQTLGLSFRLDLSTEDLLPFADLPLFQCTLGTLRTFLWHGLQGDFKGHPVLVLDHGYYGEDRTAPVSRDVLNSQQTLVIMPGGAAELPNFVLAPRGSLWADLVGSRPGLTLPVLFDLDEAGDFSRAFLLQGFDKRAIRRLFTQPIRDYFLRSRAWTVQAWDGHLLVYRAGVRHEPDDLPRLLGKAMDIRTVLNQAPSA